MTNAPNDDRRPSSDDLWREFDDAAHADRPADELATIAIDRSELIRLVGETLREKFAQDLELDQDDDYCLPISGRPVWVRVERSFPVIRIFGPVARDVYSRRATEVELGILNRDSLLIKWSLIGRTIWQEATTVALPYAPIQLKIQIDQYLSAMSSTRDDLAYRTGGKVA